jgi:phosphoribosyl 1,2-cyclic phosphodiesterase
MVSWSALTAGFAFPECDRCPYVLAVVSLRHRNYPSHIDSEGMRLTFHGVRGSTPCHGEEIRRYGGNTSCVELSIPGDPPLLLDLGTGVRYAGTAHGDVASVNCLLGHLHWDHIQGLPFYSPALRAGTSITIHGPAQSDGRGVGDTLRSVVTPPMFPVSIDEFPAAFEFVDHGDDEFTVGSTMVLSRLVPHIGPTLGYRVSWGGCSVAYISDHQEPLNGEVCSSGVRELCSGVDVLIHDAQYLDADFIGHETWGHCRVDYALRLAESCGVKTLVLFHHDPARDDDALDAVASTAAEWGREHGIAVLTASEGLVIEVTGAG